METGKVKKGSVPAGAGLVLRSQISYFDSQPVDITIAQTFVEQIPPFYSLESSSPLEFIIGSSNSLFLDLRQTSLLLRIKVVKNDGTPLTNEKLSTVNLLLSSLFKECEVIVNGKSITSESSDHYGLKSYIQTQFSMGHNRKSTQLSSAGYFKDEGAGVNIPTHPGQLKRSKLIEKSGIVELCGNLTCGLFQTNRYLAPGTQVVLRLKRMNPEFILLYQPETGTTIPATSPYKIVFVHAQLLVVRHQITEPYATHIERQLKTHKAYLGFKRSEIKLIHIPSNLYTSSTSNVLMGSLPEKILIALIPSTELIGSLGTNPYHFKDHGVQQVLLTVDSDSGTYRQEINIDATEKRYMEAYKSLNNLISNPDTDGISLAEYIDGNITFGFSVLPNNLQQVSQIIKKGKIDLVLKFKSQVTTPLTVVVYCQYDAAYTFNSDGEYALVE